MKKVLLKWVPRYLILLLFAAYWLVTVMFTMPDNYITISMYKEQQIFHTFMYQKWSFFAPPPNFNERLYYEFRHKKNKQINVYEAIGPICQMKKEKAPFNWNEDLIDYVLSGSMNSIADEMYELQEDLKYQQERKGMTYDSVTREKIREYVHKGLGFGTLRNYTAYIAEKNNLPIHDYDVRILISRIPLPRFAERNKKVTGTEEFYFISNYFNL